MKRRKQSVGFGQWMGSFDSARLAMSSLDGAPSSEGHFANEMAKNDGDEEVDVVSHDGQHQKVLETDVESSKDTAGDITLGAPGDSGSSGSEGAGLSCRVVAGLVDRVVSGEPAVVPFGHRPRQMSLVAKGAQQLDGHRQHEQPETGSKGCPAGGRRPAVKPQGHSGCAGNEKRIHHHSHATMFRFRTGHRLHGHSGHATVVHWGWGHARHTTVIHECGALGNGGVIGAVWRRRSSRWVGGANRLGGRKSCEADAGAGRDSKAEIAVCDNRGKAHTGSREV